MCVEKVAGLEGPTWFMSSSFILPDGNHLKLQWLTLVSPGKRKKEFLEIRLRFAFDLK